MNRADNHGNKAHQRRLAMQQTVTGSEESEMSDVVHHESSWVESSATAEKIETTAEVVTEISENVKSELKKKRKKLKELKKSFTQSQEETSYDLERIEHDIGDNIIPTRGMLTDKFLPVLSSVRKYETESEGWFEASDGRGASKKESTPAKNSSRSVERNGLEVLESKEISDASHSVKIQIEEETGQHIRRISQLPEENVGKDFLCDPTTEITEEEAYDFFTCVWEDEPQYNVSFPNSGGAKRSGEETDFEEEVPTEEGGDAAELLGRDFFKKDFEYCVTMNSKPCYMPLGERLKNENDSLFNPSFGPVALDLKLPNDKEARYLADEGFFVGQKPSVPNWNLNRLENRLLKQQETQWFGEDGSVKMLRNPVLLTPTRQTLSDECEAFLETAYVKPSIHSFGKWHPISEKTNGRYQLNLDISSVAFTHHPLFSQEHVLMSRLIQMCQKYNSNIQKDLVMGIKHRLKALRIAVQNLKQSVYHGVKRDVLAEERLSRLKAYQDDIRQTRKLRDLHEAEQKSLVTSITDAWNELKNLRDTQGYTSTSVRITIHEEPSDEAADMEDWENELKWELQEEKEDFEIQYEKLVDEYNAALEDWKQWKHSWKLAMKRKRLREKQQQMDSMVETESPPSEDLESSFAADENLLSEGEIPKPQPPLKFDHKTALEKLTQNATKMRRKPGDPKVCVKVEFDAAVTTSSQCPKPELQRRNNVSKCKLHFKIFYNDKKVSETNNRSLNQDFSASWGQIYKLQIVQFPESFRIEIHESGVLVAELYLPIPDSSLTSQNVNLVECQFSSDHVVTFKHTAVGSGIPYKFHDGNPTWLLTSGFVKCSLAWGIAEDGSILAPNQFDKRFSASSGVKWSDPLSKLMSGGMSSISKLREWVQRSHLDPNDPSNAAVFQIIHEFSLDKLDSQGNSEFYRLEPLQEDFNFVSSEELENNKRFHLLQLRSQGVSEFRSLHLIPADEKDLPADFLEQLQKKSETEEETVSSEGSQAQRDQAQKLMHKVREEVAKRFYAAQHQRTLEDIVVEEKVPNISTLGFSLLKLLQRKRPLYPVRKERKKVTGPTIASTEVKIMVTVLHAMNVPIRSDVDPVKERVKKKSSLPIEPVSEFESQVHPFVEVMFQRVAVKTNVAEGPHPTWNQELHLPFRAPNDDYSPTNLETVRDVIYFNLFDEVTVDLLEDEKDRESVVHERLERRWLGNLKVPFTTLYLNTKIEGTFRVNVPPVLLGYESEPRPWLIGGADGVSDSHTYLSFFITIEPCLQLPEVFREKGDSGEPERVLQEVERWRQTVIPRFPKRFIKAMAVDVTGKWILIPRFLQPIKPPDELLEAGKDSPETLELLARFVSLIPTISDSIVYPGLCDLWCTCDQFLQMRIGDEEEHSILLCNFFLYLGKKAMLLLGAGIPEGPTAYVLTWENDQELLAWNASTGEHFNIRDNHNPLQRVGCLVSSDNIWANIQKNDHPARIGFDVSRASEWKPFFSRSFPNPGIRSIQPETLHYFSTDPDFVEKLQEEIKKSLQESIMKWRRRQCTSWNSYCNQVLHKILTRLERNAGRTASVDSLQELEQILSSHKVNGFPLSMPYTDVDGVIEAVFATGVHLTEDKNAEFALAVYIHPYPCTVVAVWVYVAVLISRR